MPTTMAAAAITALALGAACGGEAGDGASASGPELPMVVEAACPFECCTYGTWVAEGAIQTVSAPDGSGTPAFTIPPGRRFTAGTGQVRIVEAGRARLTAPLELVSETGDATEAAEGTEILLLDPLGEGWQRVWHDGAIRTADLGLPGSVTVLQPVRTEWWARVSGDDGAVGWIRADEAPVHGQDACGQPMTWTDPALEAALAAFAVDRGADPPPTDRRLVASVDLNGDLADDAVVLLLGPDWCGSGGCTMAVFAATDDGTLGLVSATSLVREPVVVTGSTHGGWRDLVVRVAGGGMAATDVVLAHDGRGYPGNASTQEPLPDGAPVDGIVVFEAPPPGGR